VKGSAGTKSVLCGLADVPLRSPRMGGELLDLCACPRGGAVLKASLAVMWLRVRRARLAGVSIAATAKYSIQTASPDGVRLSRMEPWRSYRITVVGQSVARQSDPPRWLPGRLATSGRAEHATHSQQVPGCLRARQRRAGLSGCRLAVHFLRLAVLAALPALRSRGRPVRNTIGPVRIVNIACIV
jgi:hypothetical protein